LGEDVIFNCEAIRLHEGIGIELKLIISLGNLPIELSYRPRERDIDEAFVTGEGGYLHVKP
jgi:hypothetical protein